MSIMSAKMYSFYLKNEDKLLSFAFRKQNYSESFICKLCNKRKSDDIYAYLYIYEFSFIPNTVTPTVIYRMNYIKQSMWYVFSRLCVNPSVTTKILLQGIELAIRILVVVCLTTTSTSDGKRF